MRPLKTLALAAALALTALPASAQPAAPWGRYAAARQVELRDVVAIVQVTPENRTDVAVSILNPGPLASPQMRMRGDRLVIDGAMRRQIRSCTVRGEGFTVATARNGRLERPQIMTINIRVPQAAAISAGGAVRLHLAPAQSTELRLSGCGDADIERINDEADIAVSGSPDVRVYEAGSATIAVAGAGDVTLGVVRDGLTGSIAGSGDLVAARVDGPTNIAIQGSGGVIIRDGRSTTLSVAIAGSGDVVHNGSAERLDAVILGSGDVHVRRVDGEVTRRVLGSGEVRVGS